MYTRARHLSPSWDTRPVHNFTICFLRIRFNISFPSMLRSYEWSRPFRFSDQNFILIYHLSVLHVPSSTSRKMTKFIWFLSWTRWIRTTASYPISIRSILMLFYHLRLGLPNGLFPSGLPTKILYAFLILVWRHREIICRFPGFLAASNLK